MPPTPENTLVARLTQALEAQFRQLRRRQPPEVDLCFYPYARLIHTVRLDNGRLRVRLSDILADAPFPVLEALTFLLLCKLFRHRAPSPQQRLYTEFIRRPEMADRIQETRRRRGRKPSGTSRGDVFDLQAICSQLNRDYFGNRLQIDHLGWSRGKSRRTLGHFDAAHNAIIINRRLDNPAIPEYVVAFIVYHEMLHADLGEDISNGRRRIHHRRFREAERAHPDYRRAQDFIRHHLSA